MRILSILIILISALANFEAQAIEYKKASNDYAKNAKTIALAMENPDNYEYLVAIYNLQNLLWDVIVTDDDGNVIVNAKINRGEHILDGDFYFGKGINSINNDEVYFNLTCDKNEVVLTILSVEGQKTSLSLFTGKDYPSSMVLFNEQGPGCLSNPESSSWKKGTSKQLSKCLMQYFMKI